MRHLYSYLFALAITLVTATAAHAAGDAHATDWGNLAWRLLNLAIVVAIIWKLAGKKIGQVLSGRSKGIAAELESLEARKEKARQDLMDVEQRIANLESERTTILADYQARGEALEAEIVAKAKETARQITTQAQQTAQNEIETALTALREELADKIIDAASASIAKSLTAGDQQQLLQRALESDELTRSFQSKGVVQ